MECEGGEKIRLRIPLACIFWISGILSNEISFSPIFTSFFYSNQGKFSFRVSGEIIFFFSPFARKERVVQNNESKEVVELTHCSLHLHTKCAKLGKQTRPLSRECGVAHGGWVVRSRKFLRIGLKVSRFSRFLAGANQQSRAAAASTVALS
jgi:hypothetical protein